MRSPLPGLGLAALLLLPAASHAGWPQGGELVATPDALFDIHNARILELPGGDLLLLAIGSSFTTFYYQVMRVSRDGTLAAGWPAGGVPVGAVIRGNNEVQQGFAIDDSSRFWHSWSEGSTFAQGVTAAGTPFPPTGSYNLGGSGASVSRLVPAPGGEVYVTLGSTRIRRITVTGGAAAGWTTTGRALPGYGADDNALAVDGSGRAVVFLREDASSQVPIATMLPSNGAAWPAFLSFDPPGFPGNDSFNSQLLPSGSDHFIAIWTVPSGSRLEAEVAQRFALDASIDPAWPGNGLVVAERDSLTAWRAIADGTGGFYAMHERQGRPVGTHVTAAGTFTGGVDVDLLDAGAQYMTQAADGIMPRDLIADRAPDGGLLVGWNDTRLAPAPTFRLRWLTPSLTPAAGKPDTGLVVFPGSPHAVAGAMRAVLADGSDAAFVAWADQHDIGGQMSGDVWMNHVQAPPVTGVQPVPPAFALSRPRPNPVRDRVTFEVTLPGDATARIELLDVAGRRLRTQTVTGGGTRTLAIPDLGALSPGLYFVRASDGRAVRTVRVAITR